MPFGSGNAKTPFSLGRLPFSLGTLWSADTPSLPEHGSGLVGGTITLDDASFTTKITVHSGTTVSTVFRCVALLDTGSPQTFIRRDVWVQMLAGGAAAVNCEQGSAPRSWGGFGRSAPLVTSTSVCLSVQFFRAEQPTSSLAVWACVVPPSVMQHAVLLGRDSWMRFNTWSYRSFPPRPFDQRVFGELTLSHHAPTGTSAFVPDLLASGGGFHLRYDVADRVDLSDEPQLFAVTLVRSKGLPALTGHTISSKCCPSRTFFLPKNILPLQGDRSSPSVARPTSSPATF